MVVLSKVISVENPAFCAFITCGSVLVIKMMAMSIITGRLRKKHGVPASPEDVVFLKGKTPVESHADVDRVRRAHLNDVENIPLYFFAGFGYLFTEPDPTVAVNLFRIYALARIAHTLVYAIFVVPQPARGLSWGVGYGITGYMAIRTIRSLSCPMWFNN